MKGEFSGFNDFEMVLQIVYGGFWIQCFSNTGRGLGAEVGCELYELVLWMC